MRFPPNNKSLQPTADETQSATPKASETTSPAPNEDVGSTDEKRSFNWGWIAWPVVVLVLYVLSAGPLLTMRPSKYMPTALMRIVWGFYKPVHVAYWYTPLHKPLGLYLHLWDSAHFDKSGEYQKPSWQPPKGEWRSDDMRFSVQERKIITAARKYVENEYHHPVDGYYRILHKEDGYEVVIWFVAGYEDGQPNFYPGGFCVVSLGEDGSVTQLAHGM